MHISSLPSEFGIGDLGPAAYDFVVFLSNAGQRYWQILPLHPTDNEYDNSPYHALSAFAYNPLLISPERMVIDGFIESSDLESTPDFPCGQIDFPAVIAYKEDLFTLAFTRLKKRGGSIEFSRFCEKNAWWLDDYALYMVLRRKMAPLLWGDWPDELKYRNKEALLKVRIRETDDIEREKLLQYIFSIQWSSLQNFCRDRGILLIGDIPIYIDYDSADLWTNPHLFKLDESLKPSVVAGVPPDYFSENGQIWSSPVYNWEVMEKTEFTWWVHRIEYLARFVDYVRIDHFRGLIGYWEIPTGSKTAISGTWVTAPGFEFLKTLSKRGPFLPLIAEDLGIITPEIREIMRQFSIPGMKVLLFAFGYEMASSPYIPHNIPKDCVIYTGTHDNNPVLGWFTTEASSEERKNLFAYLGREIIPDEVSGELVRLAMMSVANTSIIPMQDILGLGTDARMNRPGTETGNWRWRVDSAQITENLTHKLRQMTQIFGRM